MLIAINSGSSSLKFLLYDGKKETLKGKWEKEYSRVIIKKGKNEDTINVSKMKPEEAFSWIIQYLVDNEYLKSLSEIEKVGYRYAHGGTAFVKPTEVNEEVIRKLREIDDLSTTHNPIHRKVVEMGLGILPEAKHILCFDTHFHYNMPIVATMYGIDMKYYERGVRKYGFHGLSYQYVGTEIARILEKPFSEFSGVICHLGNGSSITAIENGKSVDTTMGFTPVDGLVMGQRSGSIDPSVVQAIMKIENINIYETIEILSRESGFKGISGISPDYRILRDIAQNKEPGFERAKLALDLFQYQIRKYIGSFMAILSHVDAIVFTGGIGENDDDFVKKCIDTEGFKHLGVSSDLNKITHSTIPVLQIPTNEEIAIINVLKNY